MVERSVTRYPHAMPRQAMPCHAIPSPSRIFPAPGTDTAWRARSLDGGRGTGRRQALSLGRWAGVAVREGEGLLREEEEDERIFLSSASPRREQSRNRV